VFGHKTRHEEVINHLRMTKDSCDHLILEVREIKQLFQTLDIHHVIETIDTFIESTSYIKHILENATIEDDCDSCFRIDEE